MYAKRLSQGHWTFCGPGDEKKQYVNFKDKSEGKWNSIASQMVQRYKEPGHPVFTCASALSRGVLRRLKGREAIHFTEDPSNTELLFRIIHSVNKLSSYGAVSNWSEQFDLRPNENELTSERSAGKEDSVNEEILKSASSQEVNSLVCAPRNPPASANRLRENLESFVFAKFCELALFSHTAEVRMCYKTIQDMDDGFGGSTPYTHPHADPKPMQQFQEEE